MRSPNRAVSSRREKSPQLQIRPTKTGGFRNGIWEEAPLRSASQPNQVSHNRQRIGPPDRIGRPIVPVKLLRFFGDSVWASVACRLPFVSPVFRFEF